MKTLIFSAAIFLSGSIVMAQTDSYGDSSYASDDAHNHNGSHPAGAKNCGTNYMLPGEVARLGSHSFLILGQDDDSHIIADHRSGTPPHNYHFLLRVRLDSDEMAFYKKILGESKLTPAFTTIYFDDKDSKKQLDRTFFCLADLPKIFGDQKKKGDEFEKIFPIRASLQKDADFEGAFEIEKSIYAGSHFTIERDDVELLVFRYLPSYLEQKTFRQAIKSKPKEIVPLLSDSPSYATESKDTASKKTNYAYVDGKRGEKGSHCPKDLYANKTEVPKTIHTFLIMAALDKNTLLAVHYYDRAPHNFQTALKLSVTDKEMDLYKKAKEGTKTPPMFQSKNVFCEADIKNLITDSKFSIEGTLYKDSGLNEYKLGSKIGDWKIEGKNIQVITNRNLLSLMDPLAIAKEVLGKAYTK